MNNQELTFGEVKSMYFDEEALQLPPVSLYRLDVKGSRHYFIMNPDFDPEAKPEEMVSEYVFFSGVTTVTGSTLPKAEQLIKWIADMGYDNAIAYRDERAAYGTLMHTVFAHVLINGSIDLELVDSLVYEYAQREHLNVNIWKFTEDIKQDLIAFAQWIVDYDVKPLAIEISLCDTELGIAGTADLPCLLTIPTKGDWGEVYKSGARKGEVKLTTKGIRTMAIVDFKSGRKSYGGMLDCAAQLRLYKALWVRNITPPEEVGNIDVRLFNWSPKDWRTNPGYHFPEQTDSFSDDQMYTMIQMYKLSQKPIEEKTKTFYSGNLVLGVEPLENFTAKSAPELAHEKLANLEPDAVVEVWDYLTVDELCEDISQKIISNGFNSEE